jgi:hypothetical protein
MRVPRKQKKEAQKKANVLATQEVAPIAKAKAPKKATK